MLAQRISFSVALIELFYYFIQRSETNYCD